MRQRRIADGTRSVPATFLAVKSADFHHLAKYDTLALPPRIPHTTPARAMSSTAADFRSDTVTRPTPAMRAAMAAAKVGDDVFGDDSTVIELQERLAAMLGKEAALFVPSGTMSNLIGVRVHCRPGDALICEAEAHVHFYEQGGYAQLNGVAAWPLQGRHGVLQVEQLETVPRPDDPHFTRVRLLCLENTHNRGGGHIQPYDNIETLCAWARTRGLRTHLDGARLWNAAVASGIPLILWARHFDTVNVCFSKGLGAPVGSALVGPAELIREAVRHRKVLGGGMRQVGVLAAAALYALEHHIERLADDHANARKLADGLRQIPGVQLRPETVDTNLVYFHLPRGPVTAAELVARLGRRGILMCDTGPYFVRAVTHLDVDAKDVQHAIEAVATELQSSPRPRLVPETMGEGQG
jgi:threonine aldolase